MYVEVSYAVFKMKPLVASKGSLHYTVHVHVAGYVVPVYITYFSDK